MFPFNIGAMTTTPLLCSISNTVKGLAVIVVNVHCLADGMFC